MKYAFDHEQEKLPEGLGITDERATELIKHVRRTHINSNNTLEHFENTINAADPKNIVEAMFLGYALGRFTQMTITIKEGGRMMQALRSLLG